MIRRWLRPNAAGAMLLVLFLSVEALCGRDSSDSEFASTLVTDNPTTWAESYGVPTMVQAVGGPDTETVIDIRWSVVAATLVGAYIVTTVFGRLMTDAGVDPRFASAMPARRRPLVVMLVCVAAMVPVAMVGASVGSKLLWGYWFSRPTPDRRVLDAVEVNSITSIGIDAQGAVKIDSLPVMQRHIDEQEWRLMREAFGRRIPMSEKQPAVPDERLDAMAHELDCAGAFKEKRGMGDLLLGQAWQLKGASGEDLVLIDVSSGPITDELFVHYGFAFLIEESKPPRMLSATHYYYRTDEFAALQWSQMVRGLFVVLTVLVVLILSIMLAARRFMDRVRLRRQRGFPVTACPVD